MRPPPCFGHLAVQRRLLNILRTKRSLVPVKRAVHSSSRRHPQHLRILIMRPPPCFEDHSPTSKAVEQSSCERSLAPVKF
ncbi:hypothetical protein CEXT_560251 [Caerostris extrusa]|uniref:Uncharacterized protein n=1 Tax=Caerostris extrusa TaxID=172846 RepID=A0AAV4MJ53_CAEEX|nr:hypothetical protein CEXT_560251 [Caerostris extrusa]